MHLENSNAYFYSSVFSVPSTCGVYMDLQFLVTLCRVAAPGATE